MATAHPLVAENGKWYLDGAAGAKEIVYRRIGRNELGPLQCAVALSTHSWSTPPWGMMANPGLFAAKLRSDPGQHNGLYWPVGEGEPASPAGEEVVRAAAEGYRAVVGQRTPIMATTTVSCMLRSRCQWGQKEYFVEGQLRDGVALLAWPADCHPAG